MSSGLMTAEELLELHVPNKCTELVRGVLRVSEPPGYQHGAVVMQIALAIAMHVREHQLGQVLAAETGFTLFRNPDTVRAPDVAFISRARIPVPPPRGYAEMAPDLAVEVLSPGDRAGEVLAKAGDWLNAGAKLLWIIDPIRGRARVYRADGSEELVARDGMLSGEDVLPGFMLPLASVL